MTTFVLVHGAWHGGWCWRETETCLKDLGHETHAITLTGLGDRSHLVHRDITADTHAMDIVNALRWRELDDIILVGHSYGGLPVTGAAGIIPERIAALVYLDAFVPLESGVSPMNHRSPERLALFHERLKEGNGTIDPDGFDNWVRDPVQRDWLQKMCTPHPVRSLLEGVSLSGRENRIARKLYILAVQNDPSPFRIQMEQVAGQPGWQTVEIDAMHDAMVDAPRDLARMLDAFAQNG